MASSGYFGTSNQYIKFWIEIRQNSQNIGNNTSNITVRVWATRTNTGYTTWGDGSVYLKVECAGTVAYNQTVNKRIEITSSSAIYHEWTGNVSHYGDGTATVTASANIQIPSVLSSSTSSYSERLTTIPRTSSFTLNKTSCELGQPFTVNINSASNSFTHAVMYIIGGSGGETRYMQEWNGTSKSVSYTPPITDAVYMPNSTSMGVTIQVSTYNGSTLIGYTVQTLTVTCPSNLVPSFSSLSLEKVSNDVPVGWELYVQGHSQVRATINGASGIHGSTITKYSISGGGYSSTSSTFTTGVLNTAGTNTFTATITDSRGRTATKTSEINVTPYYSPKITSTKLFRSENGETEYEDGTGVCIQVNVDYADVSDMNSIDMKVTKITEKEDENNIVIENVTLEPNVSNFVGKGLLDTDKQYYIYISVADAIITLPVQKVKLSTAFVTMDFKAGGKGVAIGKVSLKDNFDVDMDTIFNKTVHFYKPIGIFGQDTVTENDYWLGFKNRDGYDRIRFGTATDGNGLKITTCDNGGQLLGDIKMLASDIQINNSSIVVSGSNENGEYVRYYDGTQICKKSLSLGRIPITTQWGGVYASGYKSLGTWAASFTGSVRISAQLTSNYSTAWTGTVKNDSSTSCGNIELYNGISDSNAGDFWIHVIGVGRWK